MPFSTAVNLLKLGGEEEHKYHKKVKAFKVVDSRMDPSGAVWVQLQVQTVAAWERNGVIRSFSYAHGWCPGLSYIVMDLVWLRLGFVMGLV